MSSKLLQALSVNSRKTYHRQIYFDSSKYSKRDVISVDAFEDIEDVKTHTDQVTYLLNYSKVVIYFF